MQSQLSDDLGILLSRDLFTILSVFEDSLSFIGWSDVVHCVRVPLTSTTMAVFWVCGILVGIHLLTMYLLCTILWTIGGPSILVL